MILNKKKENFGEKFVFGERNVYFDILVQEWDYVRFERLIIDLPITLVNWLMILKKKILVTNYFSVKILMIYFNFSTFCTIFKTLKNSNRKRNFYQEIISMKFNFLEDFFLKIHISTFIPNTYQLLQKNMHILLLTMFYLPKSTEIY